MPDEHQTKSVLISGIGPGLGAALCRRLTREGYAVTGLARSLDFGARLQTELLSQGGRFKFIACDITDERAVSNAVQWTNDHHGTPSVFVHNAGQILIKPFENTTPAAFEAMWKVTVYGAMLAARVMAPDMIGHGGGTMIFTGATASLRGGANFSAFASAKFALRGLAQALARELGPSGVHVVHSVLDGIVWNGVSRDLVSLPREKCMEPDAVADTYWQLIQQPPSAWTHELDIRPGTESF